LFLLSKLQIISFTGNSCVYHQGFVVRTQQRTGITTTDPFPQQQKELYYNPDTLDGYYRETQLKNVTLTAQCSLLSEAVCKVV
jgi:hypothetical protein